MAKAPVPVVRATVKGRVRAGLAMASARSRTIVPVTAHAERGTSARAKAATGLAKAARVPSAMVRRAVNVLPRATHHAGRLRKTETG
jgi:hypothetical protein